MGGIFNLRVLLVVALLGAAAVGGWWLRERIHPPGGSDADTRASAVPDYYMENFTIHAMNPSGTPRYSLTAEDMLHYAEIDRSDLTRPHAIFHQPDGPPYVLDSERGQIHNGGDRVDLLGHVDIDRSADANNRALHVTTRDARVYPNRDYAESDEFTVIRSASSHLQGIGMRAWFDQQRLQLLSQVEGTHDNTQP